MLLLVVILSLVLAIVLGYEAAKWLFSVNEKVAQKKRDAQILACHLRQNGLKVLPAILEDFVVSDVPEMLRKIGDIVKIIDSGNDVIERDLQATFDAVLDAKLSRPEGLAYVASKVAAAQAAQAPAK